MGRQARQLPEALQHQVALVALVETNSYLDQREQSYYLALADLPAQVRAVVAAAAVGILALSIQIPEIRMGHRDRAAAPQAAPVELVFRAVAVAVAVVQAARAVALVALVDHRALLVLAAAVAVAVEREQVVRALAALAALAALVS